MQKDSVIFRLPGQFVFHIWEGKFQPHSLKNWFQNHLSHSFICKPFLGDELYILNPEKKEEKAADIFFETDAEWSIHLTDTQSLIPDTKQAAHEQLINDALETFKQTSLEKVVIARKKTLPLDDSFSLTTLLKQLHIQYPQSYICMASSELFGTWIGASPEVLLEGSTPYFKTVALAGTRKKTEHPNAWGEKEIIEHAKVIEYIESVLKQLEIQYNLSPVETVSMGNIEHLYAQMILQATEKEQVEQLLQNLPPTPAVCGFPKKEALDYIIKKELLNRELYTGFWGPIIHDNLYLYVNLRCCKIENNSIVYFAGGGINALSNPEDEWNETEEKIKLLSGLVK